MMKRNLTGVLAMVIVLAITLALAPDTKALHCEGGYAGCEYVHMCYAIQQMSDGSICTGWSYWIWNSCTLSWELRSGISCLP